MGPRPPSTPSPRARSFSARHAAAALVFLGACASVLAAPGPAVASTSQISIISDSALTQAQPAQTLQQMRDLGASTVRVVLYWDSVAPKIQSTKKPKFDASDPSAYPAAKWAPYDAIVRDAAQDRLTVDFTISGGAPRWAEGPGIPSDYIIAKNPGARYFAWKPNATDYGQFVHAVAERYSGSFTPVRQTTLPRVRFWTLWNEPNFGEDLGPQATDTSRISYAPMLYRRLVRTGWSALRQTGHRGDTILIGGFAPYGSPLSMGKRTRRWPQGLPGNAGQSQPLPFIRTLYCLDATGHTLTGTAAARVGCPTNAAQRRRFRADNPALFSASGVGDHPYGMGQPPVNPGKRNPQWSTFPNMGLLERTLDGATHAWGSGRHFKIYNDEYGYITDPPQKTPREAVSVATASIYLNWAEYLSWRNPRIASYCQYLLVDPQPNPITGGGFASGLYTFRDKPKATLDAYRMPVWVPSPPRRAGRAVTVWGEARPAHWTGLDTSQTQLVQVQFRAHGRGVWRTIARAHSDTAFEVHPRLSVSGDLRLRYTYPGAAADPLLGVGVAGSTIVSRTVPVTVG